MNLSQLAPTPVSPASGQTRVTLGQTLEYRSIESFDAAVQALTIASTKLAASTGANWTSTQSGPQEHGLFRKSFKGEFNVTFSGSMDAVTGAVSAWPSTAQAALDALRS